MIIAPKILYFGTPVVLLSSENGDGSANLAPNSSAWALGHTLVLGLGPAGHTAYNLAKRPEVVINVPGPRQWAAVERLADLTGAWPVPDHKQAAYRHERDKFGAAGLTAVPSVKVRPPRVAECPLQLEALVEATSYNATDDFLIAQASVVAVHADPDIVVPGTDHVDPRKWSPLIYNFRHYFGLGDRLGHNFRAETA
ncbi:flavin reductase (DIM6/NTAB) family NADH-FMN oxidoreductase RutF [Hamadaea flava]|uniref:Flavin reductase family protein n=1 Tax=Hamadaea flava TaxID=1742688 RepID=A0ABV8LNW2_9ACTN|nr:flavin reductase family protein [Hamadaea flava]MCP2321497.1 flavin reductase (DIM6/NTAB) family NADH-FMN oxidoreductase RutF [Hamadaea flava]